MSVSSFAFVSICRRVVNFDPVLEMLPIATKRRRLELSTFSNNQSTESTYRLPKKRLVLQVA